MPPGRSACGSSATASPSRSAPPRATACTPPDDVDDAAARGHAARERACPSRPRSSGPARAATVVTDRPSIFGAVPHRGPHADAAQAHADRAVARDRGRDAGARRRPGGPRRLPARASLPHRLAPLPAAGRGAPTPPPCSPTSGEPRQPCRRAGRGADRRRLGDRATSGRSSSTRPGFSVCLCAWEPPVRQAPERRPATGSFETFWTLDAAGRASGRAGRRAVAARRGARGRRAAAGRCWPSGRSAPRRRRRRSRRSPRGWSATSRARSRTPRAATGRHAHGADRAVYVKPMRLRRRRRQVPRACPCGTARGRRPAR